MQSVRSGLTGTHPTLGWPFAPRSVWEEEEAIAFTFPSSLHSKKKGVGTLEPQKKTNEGGMKHAIYT